MVPNYAEGLRLDSKAFVVLGVGEGLGLQSCHALKQAGADVFCVDIDPVIAEEAARAVGGIAHCADVTNGAAVETLFAAALERFGAHLAGLVDVVGVANNAPFASFDDDALDWQFNIILRHAILAMQIGGPLLGRNGGGSMTFIGSISGIANLPGQSMYGAAKAALHHAVRSASYEYGSTGVRVNAIAPGFTRTPRLLDKIGPDEWERIDATKPLRRAADPSDIAGTVLFLASDLARYVTGNILTLDGGVANTVAIPRAFSGELP
jgi:NAD(P)-dependent dehydrogenase (short-subunit alcohol dehydrogenase family)